MREVCRSLLALLFVTSACGSSDPVTGSAPLEPRDMEPPLADGGVKKDAGKDASKDSSKDASPRADAKTDPSNCGRTSFNTGWVIPDMLIVLDRSGSMKPPSFVRAELRCDNLGLFDPAALECLLAGIDCNNAQDKQTIYCGGNQQRGAIDRWSPSVAALKSLTSQFQSDVSFGLMTFPAEGRSNECGPGEFKVPIGLDNASKIASALDATTPGGGTPTGQTLQLALEYFESQTSVDVARPAQNVLLVTDGQPTCPNGVGGSGGNGAALAADRKLTVDAIDALSAYGVKTYVVGYDANLDPNLAGALAEFAQHGGTDDYYPVQNEDSLVAAFDKISKAVVTCSYGFKETITDPALLHVTLDDETLRPDDPNGFVLNGQTVTIQGEACEKLQADRDGHIVEIVLECEPVVYI